MLLGAFPDAIAPGSDAAEAIVQEKYNPKLVSTLVLGCERAVHAPRSRMTNVRRAALLFARGNGCALRKRPCQQQPDQLQQPARY